MLVDFTKKELSDLYMIINIMLDDLPEDYEVGSDRYNEMLNILSPISLKISKAMAGIT